MRYLHLIVLLTVAVTAVPAQNTTEWYINKPIDSIIFDGLDTVTENELSAVVDPFIGELFTEPPFSSSNDDSTHWTTLSRSSPTRYVSPAAVKKRSSCVLRYVNGR